MARRRDKGVERQVALQRIDALLGRALAERSADAASPLPARYGALALRIAQRYQSGLAPRHKALLCRKCGAVRGGATSRTRLRAGRIATTCLACGHVARHPLAPRPAPREAPA